MEFVAICKTYPCNPTDRGNFDAKINTFPAKAEVKGKKEVVLYLG